MHFEPDQQTAHIAPLVATPVKENTNQALSNLLESLDTQL